MATKRPEEIGTNELLRIALQVADGCAYLAQRKVVHRSLKAEVVLVNNHNDVRIGGLGSIKDISLHEEYVTVNNDYVALANAQNKPRSDIRWLASFPQAFLVSFMCARTSLIRMPVSFQSPARWHLCYFVATVILAGSATLSNMPRFSSKCWPLVVAPAASIVRHPSCT